MRGDNRKSVLIWVLAVVLVLTIPKASAAFRYLHEGMTVPDIEGKDARTGERVSLKEQLHGGMTVIVFWASWSQRSLDELKDLRALADEYKDLPLSFLAVNVERQHLDSETKGRLKHLLDSLQLPFPVIIDDGLKTFYAFGVIAVPSTAVVDSSGALRYGPAGYSYTTRDRIVDSIEVLTGVRERPALVQLKTGRQPKPRASRYYRLALQMTRERMFERALAHVGSSIKADSGFAAPYCLRGEILLKLDSAKAALSSFRQALARDSTMVAAYAGLGRALLATGDTIQARDVLSKTVARDSTYTPAVLDYARLLAALHVADTATMILRQALATNPNDPELLLTLGKILREQGNLSAAIEAYRRALRFQFPLN